MTNLSVSVITQETLSSLAANRTAPPLHHSIKRKKFDDKKLLASRMKSIQSYIRVKKTYWERELQRNTKDMNGGPAMDLSYFASAIVHAFVSRTPLYTYETLQTVVPGKPHRKNSQSDKEHKEKLNPFVLF